MVSAVFRVCKTLADDMSGNSVWRSFCMFFHRHLSNRIPLSLSVFLTYFISLLMLFGVWNFPRKLRCYATWNLSATDQEQNASYTCAVKILVTIVVWESVNSRSLFVRFSRLSLSRVFAGNYIHFITIDLPSCRTSFMFARVGEESRSRLLNILEKYNM